MMDVVTKAYSEVVDSVWLSRKQKQSKMHGLISFRKDLLSCSAVKFDGYGRCKTEQDRKAVSPRNSESSGVLLLSCAIGSLLGPLQLINGIQNQVCKKATANKTYLSRLFSWNVPKQKLAPWREML